MKQRGSLVCAGLAAFALIAPAARATWSIVAVDPETREVGIAGASCIGGVDVIGGLVPGRGVVAAQGISNASGRQRAQEMLASGADPQAVVAEITSDAFDPGAWWRFTSGAKVRQYGVVALGFESAPASFTGERAFSWAGSAQGEGVSVQGNLLAGPEVVRAALGRFEELRSDCGSTLHDRLLAALEAGAQAGGDRRCVPALAALSAYLEVAGPDDAPGASSLRLVVTPPFEPDTSAFTFFRQMFWPERGGAEDSPVQKLRAIYTVWRQQHEPVGRCSD